MLIFCMSMIVTFGCSQRTRGGWKKIRCWGGTSSLGASVLLVNSALEPESETCLFCKQRNDPVTGLTFLWRWTMKFTEASSSRGQPKKHTFLNVFIVSYHRAAVQPNFQRWGRCQLPSSIITAPARWLLTHENSLVTWSLVQNSCFHVFHCLKSSEVKGWVFWKPQKNNKLSP